MNYQPETSKEVWGGVNTVINTWLFERQELIRLYCDLTDLNDPAEFRFRLAKFCEVLVDYTSAGHFEVFTGIEHEAHVFDERELKIIKTIYPHLTRTTEVILWFNDQCEYLNTNPASTERVRADLSYLGETLSERFDLEDRLISSVHKRNQPIVN